MATEGKDREEIPVFTQFGKRKGHLNRNTRTVSFDAEKSSFTKGTLMCGWCYYLILQMTYSLETKQPLA